MLWKYRQALHGSMHDACILALYQVGSTSLVTVDHQHGSTTLSWSCDFVSGALEGFAAYGLFHVVSVTKKQEDGSKISFEVVLSQPSGSIFSSDMNATTTADSDLCSDAAGFSLPSSQFCHLMPFHILLDGLGNILQLGEGLEDCLGAAQIGHHIGSCFQVQYMILMMHEASF